MQRIDAFYQALEAYPKDLMLATTAADIRKAKARGQGGRHPGPGRRRAHGRQPGAAALVLSPGRAQPGPHLEFPQRGGRRRVRGRSAARADAVRRQGDRGMQPAGHPDRRLAPGAGRPGGRAAGEPTADHRLAQQRRNRVQQRPQPDRRTDRGHRQPRRSDRRDLRPVLSDPRPTAARPSTTC